jgi:chromosome segregation ATPase
VNFSEFWNLSKQLTRIEQTLTQITGGQKTLMSQNAKFDADIQKLTAQVADNTTAFKSLAAIKGQEEAIIKDQAQQIADLKAANPELDLSALEENIAQLTATNVAAAEILPPAPEPVAA